MVLQVSSSRISLRLIRSRSTAASFHISTHFLPSAICSGVQSANGEDLSMQEILARLDGSRWGVPATFYSRSSSLSSTGICASTMSQKFNSPQRVKARCFAVFASAFGCVAFSSVAIRTSNAADFVAGSSPARQIISASAAIFSSLTSSPSVSRLGNPRRRSRLRLRDARVQQATGHSSPKRNG